MCVCGDVAGDFIIKSYNDICSVVYFIFALQCTFLVFIGQINLNIKVHTHTQARNSDNTMTKLYIIN